MAAMIGRLLRAMSILLLLTQLGACSTPTDQDVIGRWVSEDGGQLILDKDGRFKAHSMPRHVFFDRRHGDTPVDGGGDWKLQKGTAYWEVRLSFRGVPEYPQGFDTSVLVTGSGDSTTLFQWIEDQGSQRYEFKRQPSPPAE